MFVTGYGRGKDKSLNRFANEMDDDKSWLTLILSRRSPNVMDSSIF